MFVLFFKKKQARLSGGFLKWWYLTTIGFPTENDHFGVFWGYHHFLETPIKSQAFKNWFLKIQLQDYSPLLVERRFWILVFEHL